MNRVTNSSKHTTSLPFHSLNNALHAEESVPWFGIRSGVLCIVVSYNVCILFLKIKVPGAPCFETLPVLPASTLRWESICTTGLLLENKSIEDPYRVQTLVGMTISPIELNTKTHLSRDQAVPCQLQQHSMQAYNIET